MRARFRLIVAGLALQAGCSDNTVVEPPLTYTVGGTLTGLAGTGLVLTNDFKDDISPQNGPFTFLPRYADGSFYSVRVATQPTGPDQVCAVENGTGHVGGGDVTGILVTCATPGDNEHLDRTFNVTGRVTADLVDGAHGLALQPDGRIIVINQHSVARFHADGSPDVGFGSNGQVDVEFPGIVDRLHGLAVQPDGRIIVAGETRFGDNYDVALARFSPDGALDASFGSGGVVTTDFDGVAQVAYRVLVQADGRIVVAGIHRSAGTDSDFALFRYLPDGSIDTGFGNGGIATVDIGGRADIAQALAIQSDGKLLVAGRVADTGGADPDVGIARFNSDGTLDTTFGVNGVAGTLASVAWDEARGIAVQADGRIVVVGVLDPPGMTRSRFLVMRLNSDGSLDGSFGSGGFAEHAHFSDEGDSANAVAIQPDGRIVVVGQSAYYGVSDFAVARFDADGSLDATFADGGLTSIDFFAAADFARAVVITPDGGILVAGYARDGNVTRLGMAKVKP
jgi:uncharacterized delta-60 repeat protein